MQLCPQEVCAFRDNITELDHISTYEKILHIFLSDIYLTSVDELN